MLIAAQVDLTLYDANYKHREWEFILASTDDHTNSTNNKIIV